MALEDWLQRHPGRSITEFFFQAFDMDERTKAIANGELPIEADQTTMDETT
jgi:hypothetical protein